MNQCPGCKQTTRQVKVGKTLAGSQRYKCQHCSKKYTPEAKTRGYSKEVRDRAVRMYVDGLSFRRVARHVGVHHQTVVDWVNAHEEALPQAPVPEQVEVVEMDELFTYIGEKKTKSTF